MSRKRIALWSVFCAVAFVIAELVARYGLGLGDPPISIPDPEIDYLFAPDQDCHRFGNRIVYNNCSMRCDFDVHCGFEGRRVFVVGDSVVNGGTLIAHEKIATTLLQERVDPTRKRIQICHVSAGSWGPGNYAAYFRRYGDIVSTNDILVLEMNSHDLWEDDPAETGGGNVGKDVALVAKKPFCALYDGFSRYFVPMVRRKLGIASVNTKVDLANWGHDLEDSSVAFNIRSLKSVLSLPFRKRYLLIHRSRDESKRDSMSLGETRLRQFAQEMSLPVIELSLEGEDYRDIIHMAESGHEKMAKTIFESVFANRSLDQ